MKLNVLSLKIHYKSPTGFYTKNQLQDPQMYVVNTEYIQVLYIRGL